jgi:integrase
MIYRSATVFVRHGAGCNKNCEAGTVSTEERKCNCRKSVTLYDQNGIQTPHGLRTQVKLSAKTRNWEDAEKQCQEWLDSFDPDKIKIKKLEEKQTEKEQKTATIEKAVETFLNRKPGKLARNTLNGNRGLFGTVQDGTVIRPGKLFSWLEKQNPRPVFVNQIKPEHLFNWQNSWNYGSDMTAYVASGSVREFLRFCHRMTWIPHIPYFDRPSVEPGNRTATFTDAQYAAILAEAKKDPDPKVVAFLELLRWSGMAIIDGVLFDTSLVVNGVLKYNRQKTKKKKIEPAVVLLPSRVTSLLRGLHGKPFRRADCLLESDIQFWRLILQDLFKRAGVETAVTAQGKKRKCGPHMLRDTCAVWYLRHQIGGTTRNFEAVAKMLGHSSSATTKKYYAPFVEELENLHVEEMKTLHEDVLREADAAD